MTEEQMAVIKQGIGPTIQRKGWPLKFTRLTGAMLRELVNKGAVKIRQKGEPWDIDSDLFKGGRDEEALAFLETFPRFFAQGFIYKDSITIDTIWGAKDVRQEEGNLRSHVTYLEPKLTKTEIFAFANLFHNADEFDLNENFAYAWFD